MLGPAVFKVRPRVDATEVDRSVVPEFGGRTNSADGLDQLTMVRTNPMLRARRLRRVRQAETVSTGLRMRSRTQVETASTGSTTRNPT